MNRIGMLLSRSLVLASLAASACVHVPRLETLTTNVSNEVAAAKQAQKLETSKPQAAAEVYNRILSEWLVYKPRADYVRQFSTELSQISSASTPTFAPDSVLGLAHVYDWAVEANARARIGLARLANARGDLTNAEKHAGRALVFLNREWGFSPLIRARLDIDCFGVLEDVYNKSGKPVRALKARMNADLMRAYLSDVQAQRDAQDATRIVAEDEKKMKAIDEFTDKVNSQRTSNALAAATAVLGAVSVGLSTVQQIQINDALAKSGGHVTPEIQQMQASKAVNDFNIQMMSLNPDFKRGADMAGAALSPLQNITVSRQLVNPDYGRAAPQIIKAFAASVAAVSSDPRVKQAAAMVNSSVDSVVAARAGNPQQLGRALDGFVESFAVLETRADGVKAEVRR
jgi:hypothetical protein